MTNNPHAKKSYHYLLTQKGGNPPTHTLSQNAYEQRIHKWTSSTQKTQGENTEHQPESFVKTAKL